MDVKFSLKTEFKQSLFFLSGYKLNEGTTLLKSHSETSAISPDKLNFHFHRIRDRVLSFPLCRR